MYSPLARRLARIQLKLMKYIWFAFVVSIILYIGIVFLIGSPEPGQEPKSSPLLHIFLIAATVAGFLSRYFPKKLDLMAQNQLAEAQHTGGDIPIPPGLGGAELDDYSKMNFSEQKLIYSARTLLVSRIVGWALAESVAIFGFLLAFLTQKPLAIVPFATASFVLFLLSRPVTERQLSQRWKR